MPFLILDRIDRVKNDDSSLFIENQCVCKNKFPHLMLTIIVKT